MATCPMRRKHFTVFTIGEIYIEGSSPKTQILGKDPAPFSWYAKYFFYFFYAWLRRRYPSNGHDVLKVQHRPSISLARV